MHKKLTRLLMSERASENESIEYCKWWLGYEIIPIKDWYRKKEREGEKTIGSIYTFVSLK